MGFSAPKTLTVAATTVKAKSDRPELNIAGVEKLASLAALIEALQTRYATLDADIRTEAGEYMIAEGTTARKQPLNPVINEGVGSANFQLKSRSSASAITDEVYEALQAAGIPVEVKAVQQSFLAVYATNTLRAASANRYHGLQHAVNAKGESTKRVSRKVVTLLQ